MSTGEIAFLALVLCAFATFIGVVGFMSIWSRTPRKPSVLTGTVAAPGQSQGRLRMKWEKADLASGDVPRPARAA